MKVEKRLAKILLATSIRLRSRRVELIDAIGDICRKNHPQQVGDVTQRRQPNSTADCDCNHEANHRRQSRRDPCGRGEVLLVREDVGVAHVQGQGKHCQNDNCSLPSWGSIRG